MRNEEKLRRSKLLMFLSCLGLSHNGFSGENQLQKLISEIVGVEDYQIQKPGSTLSGKISETISYELKPERKESLKIEWWVNALREKKLDEFDVVLNWKATLHPAITIEPFSKFSLNQVYYSTMLNYSEHVVNYGFHLFVDNIKYAKEPSGYVYWNLNMASDQEAAETQIKKKYPQISVIFPEEGPDQKKEVLLDSLGFSDDQISSPRFWLRDLPHPKSGQYLRQITRPENRMFDIDSFERQYADTDIEDIIYKIKPTLNLTELVMIDTLEKRVFYHTGPFSFTPEEYTNFKFLKRNISKEESYMHVVFIVDGKKVYNIYHLKSGKIAFVRRVN